ncbi:hypothetical protein ABIA38_000462 [Embleya sp. AB8]
MEIDIDTGEVRTSATRVAATAGATVADLRTSLASSDAVAGNHVGWSSAAALRRCATANG